MIRGESKQLFDSGGHIVLANPAPSYPVVEINYDQYGLTSASDDKPPSKAGKTVKKTTSLPRPVAPKFAADRVKLTREDIGIEYSLNRQITTEEPAFLGAMPETDAADEGNELFWMMVNELHGTKLTDLSKSRTGRQEWLFTTYGDRQKDKKAYKMLYKAGAYGRDEAWLLEALLGLVEMRNGSLSQAMSHIDVSRIMPPLRAAVLNGNEDALRLLTGLYTYSPRLFDPVALYRFFRHMPKARNAGILPVICVSNGNVPLCSSCPGEYYDQVLALLREPDNTSQVIGILELAAEKAGLDNGQLSFSLTKQLEKDARRETGAASASGMAAREYLMMVNLVLAAGEYQPLTDDKLNIHVNQARTIADLLRQDERGIYQQFTNFKTYARQVSAFANQSEKDAPWGRKIQLQADLGLDLDPVITTALAARLGNNLPVKKALVDFAAAHIRNRDIIQLKFTPTDFFVFNELAQTGMFVRNEAALLRTGKIFG